ncbi:MAG: glycosyltransferase family 2 protein [Chloroflexota bacterium]
MAAVPDSSVFVLDPEEMKRYELLLGKNIVVVIPAYNEARFIGSVILGLEKYVSNIIVVDDGSTDNTGEIARTAGALVVRNQGNQGKGVALNRGFQEAQKFSPEAVVMLDADGQHQVDDLPEIVGPILDGSADLVIGSRYLDEKSEVPKHRVIGHWFFNLFTKSFSGTQSSDSQNGYRAFSEKALKEFAFSSKGFSVESEMQFIAKELDLRVKEVPVTIQYLDKPKRSVWRQGMNVLAGIIQLVGQYRPLLFFGMPGALLLGGGFFAGLRVVEIFRRTTQIAVGTAMISVMLAIIGAVMISTGITLHSVRGLLNEFYKNRKL